MKKTKPHKFYAYGILNAYGEFWSHESFYTKGEAERKIKEVEEKYGSELPNHKVIEIEVIFTPIVIIKRVKKL